MTLVEAIEQAVAEGRIPRLWTTRHLRNDAQIAQAFSVSTLNTDPNNRSVSPCRTVAGANVSVQSDSPYLRFDPSNNPAPRRPYWFCLRKHYRPGIDPAEYQAPMTDAEADAAEAASPACPPAAAGPMAPPTPEADGHGVAQSFSVPPPTQDFERAVALVQAGQHAQALLALLPLGEELSRQPEARGEAHWGHYFALVGHAALACGEIRQSYVAYDHAWRWFQGHAPGERPHLDPPALRAFLASLSADLPFRLARLMHALQQDELIGDGSLPSGAFDAVLGLYTRSEDPRRFLYLAALGHLLDEPGLVAAAGVALRSAGLPASTLEAIASGAFTIVNDEWGASEDGERQPLIIYTAEEQDAAALEQVASLDWNPLFQALSPAAFPARYELLQVLGEGAFGVTHLARDRRTGAPVAIKLLKTLAATAEQVQAFVQEAGKLSLLGHYGGVVALLDHGIDDTLLTGPRPYIAMEYMAGGALRDHIADPAVGWEVRLGWMRQLADALVSLHTHPLLHRDLKPENIFVSRDRREVKVGDLGIASVVVTLEPKRFPDAAYGTLAYMAPEQFPPRSERSQRSEIFSMGMVYFEILSRGHHPFLQPGMSREAFVAALSGGIDAAALASIWPESLVQFLARCLAPEPGDRFADAEGMREALDHAIATMAPPEATEEVSDDDLLHHAPKWIIDKGLVQSVNLGDRPIPLPIKEKLIWKYFGPRGELASSGGDDQFARYVMERVPVSPQEVGYVRTLLLKQPIELVDFIKARSDLTKNKALASVPRLNEHEVAIDPGLVLEYPELVGDGLWAEVTLALDIEFDKKGEVKKATPRIKSLKPFEERFELERLAELRARMSTRAWLAFIVRSMGYRPEAYTWQQQLWLLTRLVPLVQNNVNLIELAPKGTGKSYVFQKLSRNSWVSTAMLSRPSLFYNVQKGEVGEFAKNACVVIDECQSSTFNNPVEVLGVLKDFLESGSCTVGSYTLTSGCSFVMLGNIDIDQGQPAHPELLRAGKMPEVYRDTAFLDRIHGILPGWEIPKMKSDASGNGLGLQAGILSQWFQVLREQNLMGVLDDWLHPVSGANLRDVRAVKRLMSGYVKLLFPHLLTQPGAEIAMQELVEYALKPALEMRGRVRSELHLKSPGEFRLEMPVIQLGMPSPM